MHIEVQQHSITTVTAINKQLFSFLVSRFLNSDTVTFPPQPQKTRLEVVIYHLAAGAEA